jgi:ribosomal subunit interface protein
MQVPLQITLRGIAGSDALEAHIRRDLTRLEKFHPRLASCRVAVDESARHQQRGREFRVRIDLRIPGRDDIIATRSHNGDVYVALRDAFDAARRQLQDVTSVGRSRAPNQ